MTKQDLGEEGKHSRTVWGVGVGGWGAEVKERCLFKIGQGSHTSKFLRAERRGSVRGTEDPRSSRIKRQEL